MAKKRIYIDPGHGGTDSGATGNKLKEDDINLLVGKQAREGLIRCGFDVKMSRTTDVKPSLSTRYNEANAWPADLFVSIHFNAGPVSAKGVEVIYPKGTSLRVYRSKKLANLMFKYLSITTPWSDRTIYQDKRGLAVLNGTKMPAVINECEFITNSEAAKLISTTSWQNLAGEAMAKAVCDYYGVKFVPATSPQILCHNVSKMPVLKEGSKGTNVKHLQRDLNRKNKAGLKIDGMFGPATEKAVKAYQKKKGLSADGIVGPKTWKALL